MGENWVEIPVFEVSCPTKYFPEASSINFIRSSQYGLGCLWNSLLCRLARMGLASPRFLSRQGARLPSATAVLPQ